MKKIRKKNDELVLLYQKQTVLSRILQQTKLYQKTGTIHGNECIQEIKVSFKNQMLSLKVVEIIKKFPRLTIHPTRNQVQNQVDQDPHLQVIQKHRDQAQKTVNQVITSDLPLRQI
jgi:hypothetical protein